MDEGPGRSGRRRSACRTDTELTLSLPRRLIRKPAIGPDARPFGPEPELLAWSQFGATVTVHVGPALPVRPLRPETSHAHGDVGHVRRGVGVGVGALAVTALATTAIWRTVDRGQRSPSDLAGALGGLRTATDDPGDATLNGTQRVVRS